MSDDIYIDVNYLTQSERDAILQVLAKDEELRKQEKRRIGKLKNELDEIKKNGASEDEISSSRICVRCRSPLGLIFSSGALCPKCEARVCKECRKENIDNTSWLCILCAKIREVRSESGAWFFEQERRKGDRPQLYGSALVRASFRRAKPTSKHKKAVIKDTEPGSPPVITLDLDNHGGKLHRPVPVHMSRLVEKEAEEEEKRNAEEVNQNYVKQYVKANRVPQKDEEEEEQSDEQEEGSSISRSSTPRGSPVHDLGNDDVEVPEETVFDHLVNQHHTTTETTGEMDEEINRDDEKQWDNHPHEYDAINGYGKDEAQDYEDKVNNWEIEREESEHNSEEVKHEAAVEIKTKWHEVADEWADTGNGYGQPAQGSHPQMAFLGVRPASPDSETTGEFFTPLATPLHSGTGTPVLSEHGQSEEGLTSGSEMYEDADEAMPIEGDRTPVAELSEEDGEDNIADVTVSNPDITLAAFPEDSAESEKRNRVSTQDNDIDDIDQAFANYGGNHPDMHKQKTLQGQLNVTSMGSRESIVSYYSDAGEGRFGNIAVTGEVLFGLRYDKHKYQLEVQIHRAKDIAPADEKRGRSDPYVKVYLLPDKTKGGKRKTKTKKNTLEPDFDEILKFKIGFDEMLTRTLWLAMWNYDTFGHNDFLGEVMLPLDTYQESGFNWDDPSPNWYPLQDRRPEPSLLSYSGDLTFSLMFEPGEEPQQDKKKKKKKSGGKLHVQLKEARNLPAKDANGFSDPFVKSYLLPDTSKKTKHKTAVVKKNLNPVWNHSFSYDNQTIEELRNHVLELTVWDYDRGSSNDFLGGMRLGLGNKMEPWDDSQGLEIEAWQLMLERPNKWHEYTLNLRSTMDSQVD